MQLIMLYVNQDSIALLHPSFCQVILSKSTHIDVEHFCTTQGGTDAIVERFLHLDYYLHGEEVPGGEGPKNKAPVEQVKGAPGSEDAP